MTTEERNHREPERKRRPSEPAPAEEVPSSADHDVVNEEVMEKNPLRPLTGHSSERGIAEFDLPAVRWGCSAIVGEPAQGGG